MELDMMIWILIDVLFGAGRDGSIMVLLWLLHLYYQNNKIRGRRVSPNRFAAPQCENMK